LCVYVRAEGGQQGVDNVGDSADDDDDDDKDDGLWSDTEFDVEYEEQLPVRHVVLYLYSVIFGWSRHLKMCIMSRKIR